MTYNVFGGTLTVISSL